MTEIPEGTSVEITPGTVGAGLVVNGDSGAVVEPEFKVLYEKWIAGKLYQRVQYPDGRTRLIPA